MKDTTAFQGWNIVGFSTLAIGAIVASRMAVEEVVRMTGLSLQEVELLLSREGEA